MLGRKEENGRIVGKNVIEDIFVVLIPLVSALVADVIEGERESPLPFLKCSVHPCLSLLHWV